MINEQGRVALDGRLERSSRDRCGSRTGAARRTDRPIRHARRRVRGRARRGLERRRDGRPHDQAGGHLRRRGATSSTPTSTTQRSRTGSTRRGTRSGSIQAVPEEPRTRPCNCSCASRRWGASRTRRCSTSRSAALTPRSAFASCSASCGTQQTRRRAPERSAISSRPGPPKGSPSTRRRCASTRPRLSRCPSSSLRARRLPASPSLRAATSARRTS